MKAAGSVPAAVPAAILAVLLALLAQWPAGAADKAAPGAKGGTIVVSILPQAYFVERISGGAFRASVLVGPGQNPHSYEPTPRQVADLAIAAAWMTIGVEFEKGLAPKVAALYPKLRIVDTTVGVEYRHLEAHRHGGEAEKGGAEAEGGPDIHVWLGRKASKRIAANVRDALARIDPAGAPLYKRNCEILVGEVDELFERLGPRLEPLRGKPVFVYHPSFGYFLDEFGIEQEAVETGGKEPTQKNLAALVAEARKDGAKLVFAQAQFPSSAARTVAAAIGGSVELVDDLAPDWLANLGRLGAALEKAAR